MNLTEKEERLNLLKHVHAQRHGAKQEHTKTESKLILPVQKLGSESMLTEEKDITPIPRQEEKVLNTKLNGASETKIDSENNGMPGTTEQNLPTVKHNSLVESNTGRSTDLKEHLKNLREASSQSMNLLDSTTEHLHGLMKGLGHVSEEANPMKADPYRNQMVINQTVNVANQLHKAMKLKLDTVKVLHKISTDIGD